MLQKAGKKHKKAQKMAFLSALTYKKILVLYNIGFKYYDEYKFANIARYCMKHNQQKQNINFTAADYYRRAEYHRTAIRRLWGDFVVSGIFAAAAIAVLAFFTIAWFADNTRVKGTTGTLSAQGERYTLTALPGNDAQNGAYEADTETSHYLSGLGLELFDAMQVGKGSNMLNLTLGQNLYPGASGKMDFAVRANTENLGSITVTLEENLVTRRKTNESSGQKQSGVLLNGSAEGDAAAAQKLMQGHLLLFLNYSDQNGYSAWLPLEGEYSAIAGGIMQKADSKAESVSNIAVEAGKIIIPAEDLQGAGTTVQFTVYWVWPERFRSLVYTARNSYYKDLFSSESSNDYLALLADMNRVPGKYLKDISALQNGEEISQINMSDNFTLYNTYSKSYDLADELIGNELEFLQLRLQAEETEASGQESGEEP